MTNLEIATKIENCFNAIHNGFKQLKHDKKQELLKINSKDKTYIFLTKDEEDGVILFDLEETKIQGKKMELEGPKDDNDCDEDSII